MSRALRATLCLAALLPTISAAADPADEIAKETTRGPVTATVTLRPAHPAIGDPLELTLRVVADAGVELLLPEFGEALERFPVLDFVPASEVDAQGRTVATQTYRLDAPRSGQLRIPPLLVEFVDRRPGKAAAPDGLDAYELLTDAIAFEVASAVPVGAAADLAPPLEKLERIAPPARVPWTLIAAVAAAVAVAGYLGLRAFARWRRRARRQSAYAIARGRLDRLLSQPVPTDRGGLDAFFVALSAVVRRYLEDRYDLRAPELTTEEFLDAVSVSPDLGADHRGLLRDFLRRADLVKFARFVPEPEQVRESIALAERFLEDTRENAPLLDVDAEPSAAGAGAGSAAHG